MADLGFRVDEGMRILLYKKCSKYNLGRRQVDDYIGEPAQQYAYPEEATAAAYAQVQAAQQQQAAAAAAAAQGHMQIDNQVCVI